MEFLPSETPQLRVVYRHLEIVEFAKPSLLTPTNVLSYHTGNWNTAPER